MSLQTGHIGISVTDLTRSIAYYTELFGFELAHHSEEEGKRFAFLAQDGQLLVTLWEQATAEFDQSRAGLHHLSFQVDSLDEVQAFQSRLKERGASFLHDGVVAHGEGAASGGIFFEDPDGTRLEVFTPQGLEAHAPATAGAPSCGFF